MIRPLEHPWVVVGAGRLGGLIALMASEAGVERLQLWSRSRPPTVDVGETIAGDLSKVWEQVDGAIVWLTVADQAILPVARDLAASGASPALTLHGSGSVSSDVLREAGVAGPVGSLHPLLSVAQPSKALMLVSDVAWTYEGSDEGRDVAQWLLAAHDNEPRVIESEKKLLYHAAAVAASGLVTATVDLALEIAGAAGIEAEDAREMLVPLVVSTAENLRQSAPVDVLTGPVAREDAATIRDHIEALERLSNSEVARTYRILTRRLASAELRRDAGLED